MRNQALVSALEAILTNLDRVVVAFSGGADSTLLLAMCLRTLGPDHVLAVTADSPTMPRSELKEAIALASELEAEHLVIQTDELHDERFASNPPERCYFCKAELFGRMRAVADERGYQHLAYGATVDDLGDHRPGMLAAKEARAVAPLLLAGFGKGEVRELSRELGLRTWDKPAMACLSSRLPYGSGITAQNLLRVELSEDLLRLRLGFREVRVRDHGVVARIEVPVSELGRLIQEPVRGQVICHLKRLGYKYVAIDMEGFRSGSMNEALASSDARQDEPITHELGGKR